MDSTPHPTRRLARIGAATAAFGLATAGLIGASAGTASADPTTGTVTLIPSDALVGLNPLYLNLTSVSATLSGPDGPMAGQQVAFTIGTVDLCTATTNAAGVASCRTTLADDLQILAHDGFECVWVGDHSPGASGQSLIFPKAEPF